MSKYKLEGPEFTHWRFCRWPNGTLGDIDGREKYLPWIEARRCFHLSDAHIQMARELGLNPKKFGSLANTKQEPWKLPLPEFIEELYFKHFKKSRPENVRSIEQMVSDARRKREERRARKQAAPHFQPPSEGPLR